MRAISSSSDPLGQKLAIATAIQAKAAVAAGHDLVSAVRRRPGYLVRKWLRTASSNKKTGA
jgi:hypothetical protein